MTDFSDISTNNRWLDRTISPVFQRLIKPNTAEKTEEKLGPESVTAVFKLRELIESRSIEPEILRVTSRPTSQLLDLQSRIVMLQAELDDLQSSNAALHEQLMQTNQPQSPPPPADVPALAVLDKAVAKTALKLGQLLMDMSELDELDTKPAKEAIQSWYNYRRIGTALPELTKEQWQAAELMDAIYMSFKNPDDGRKQVQDSLNYQFWKMIHPGGKITLQNKPAPNKISFNSKAPR